MWRIAFARPAANLKALDGLRAWAILLVLCDHAVFFGHVAFHPPIIHQWISMLTLVGRYGVDLFFLLSGFLIARLLITPMERTGRLAFKRFYVRRSLRIFPAYYLALGLNLLSYGLGGPPYGGAQPLTATHVLSRVFYLSNYAPSGPMLWSWSLATEEQFYLFLPLMLLVVWKLPPHRRAWCFVALAFVPLLARWGTLQIFQASMPLASHTQLASAWLWATWFPFHTHSEALFVGVACAGFSRWSPRFQQVVRRGRRWWAPCGLLGFAAALWTQTLLDPSHAAFWWAQLTGATTIAWTGALLMMGGLAGGNVVSHCLAWRGWYPIARVSYGMYLLHPMLNSVVGPALNAQGWFHTLNPWLALSLLLSANVLATYLAALLLFCLVEYPFLVLRDRVSA